MKLLVETQASLEKIQASSGFVYPIPDSDPYYSLLSVTSVSNEAQQLVKDFQSLVSTNRDLFSSDATVNQFLNQILESNLCTRLPKTAASSAETTALQYLRDGCEFSLGKSLSYGRRLDQHKVFHRWCHPKCPRSPNTASLQHLIRAFQCRLCTATQCCCCGR